MIADPERSRQESPAVPMVAMIAPTVASSLRAGIKIDARFFQEMSRRLYKELDLIQQEIFKIAGGDFNLNSTPQLRQVLAQFERVVYRHLGAPADALGEVLLDGAGGQAVGQDLVVVAGAPPRPVEADRGVDVLGDGVGRRAARPLSAEAPLTAADYA